MADCIDFVEGTDLAVDSLGCKDFGNSSSWDFAESCWDSYCQAGVIENYTEVSYSYQTWVVEEPESNSSKNSENYCSLYYNWLANYSVDIVYLG